MKYLLFICADGLPSPEDLAVLQRECPGWVKEMDGRGIRLMGRELELPETAATVRVRHGETLVTDGPFAETKEFVAGFDVVECADLDEAIEVTAKHPSSWFQAIEIRPFRDGLEWGEKAERFARGDDSSGAPYCLLMCVDGIPAAPEVEEAVRRDGEAWRRDLEARGLQILGHPLQHKDTATTVRVREGETLLSDGPFIETKEFIGGIDVITCADRDQAIEIAAAHPLARHHMIEVRPFWSE
ncbi:MAG: YciI family protein [Acidimicrobiales bacterium]